MLAAYLGPNASSTEADGFGFGFGGARETLGVRWGLAPRRHPALWRSSSKAEVVFELLGHLLQFFHPFV